MQNRCLTEGFFANLDIIYENCYRINPNPSEAFIDRMQLIEIEARKLRDELEEIQASTYKYQDPKPLTDEEASWLKDYDRRTMIINGFMPYITAAFFLSCPPLKGPSDEELLGSFNNVNYEQEVVHEVVPESQPMIVLDGESDREQERQREEIEEMERQRKERLREQEREEMVMQQELERQREEKERAQEREEKERETERRREKEERERVRVFEAIEKDKEEERRQREVPHLNWDDMQSCYPNSSLITFLQQCCGTAIIIFDEEHQPILYITSLKGTYQYEYKLTEVAFKYDIDSILDERIIVELQTLVEDLE